MNGIAASPVRQGHSRRSKQTHLPPKIDDEIMEELKHCPHYTYNKPHTSCGTKQKEAFRLFDTKSTGSVNAIEVKSLFIALGFNNIKKPEIQHLLSNIDKTGTDDVTFDEFVEMASPKILSRNPQEEIGKIFDLFDEEGDGVITFENLKKVSSELGEKYSDKEMRQMVEEADRKGNGGIQKDDFYRIMMKGKNGDPLDYLSDDD